MVRYLTQSEINRVFGWGLCSCSMNIITLSIDVASLYACIDWCCSDKTGGESYAYDGHGSHSCKIKRKEGKSGIPRAKTEFFVNTGSQ